MFLRVDRTSRSTNSVEPYGSKHARAPERAPRVGPVTKPLQPLVQLFGLFLDISKEVIVISWQWPLLGHPIAKFRGGEGVPKPGPRRLFVRGGGSSEFEAGL